MTRRLFAPRAPLILRRTLLAGLGSAALAPTSVLAADAPKPAKPPVPPGRDPGGVMVALIGSGIDYTRPDIAPRLARDGEGYLVGWDFIDGDRSPFLPPLRHGDGSVSEHQATAAAQIILAEAPAARLGAFRVRLADLATTARATSAIAAGPARVVLVVADGDLTADIMGLLAEAARRFPRLLIISGWANAAPNPRAPNVLTVAECRADGSAYAPLFEAPKAPSQQDLCAGLAGAWPQDADAAFETGYGIGAARVAALAARIAAREPDLDGAGLAKRITALAEPQPDGAQRPARFGCICEPRRHFWPE
jgi:hypothetical protein